MIRPLPNPIFNVSTPDGKNGILIKPLTLSPHYGLDILSEWEKTKTPSVTYNTDHGRERGRKSYDVRAPCTDELTSTIKKHVIEAASFYNYVGREPTVVSKVALVYESGSGCPVHCDDQDPADGDYGLGSTRFNWANQLVALLYLSTQGVDFEGGELYFPNANLKLSPEYGKLIMFPGHYKYKHGVMPITSGKRVVMQTTWRFDI